MSHMAEPNNLVTHVSNQYCNLSVQVQHLVNINSKFNIIWNMLAFFLYTLSHPPSALAYQFTLYYV